jgi:hypothetical protein
MSHWYKCDLQVATPAWKFKQPAGTAYDFNNAEDRSKFADDYMSRLKGRGIEVIALADHHTAEWHDAIRAAGKRAGITVFPGVEVTTGTGSDGVHVLLIGDLDQTAQDIDIILAKHADLMRKIILGSILLPGSPQPPIDLLPISSMISRMVG